MISLVLADDHSIVRRGFKMLLEQQPDFKILGEAADPNSAFELVCALKPNVLLSDISMGTEKNGLLLVERIREAKLPTHVVILTMHETQEYLVQAMSVGAMGYLLKSSGDDELFKAIRRAARGEVYVCDDMVGGFVRNSLRQVNAAAESLTPREAEVVALAVKGHSNQEIAQSLSISVKTVESQKAKIMQKLGLESKPELFDYAVKHGLVKIQ